MNEDHIFESLVRSAFDFLDRAVKEFDSDPKFSVIHFCASLEMILKARLLREHWSLIVAKPEQANKTKMMKGDFASVTIEQARERLRDVASEDLGDDAFATFRGLANHRNKLVHFFHADMEGSPQERAKIVAEQCRAWFHLHRLMTRWDFFFEPFRQQIAHADTSMKKHRTYLQAKFEALQSEIAEAVKKGTKVHTCSVCAFDSALAVAVDAHMYDVRCLVCEYRESQLEMTCPGCTKLVLLAGSGWGTCTHCGTAITPNDIFNVLHDADSVYVAMKDGDDSVGRANCSHCGGNQTVAYVNPDYVCSECFERSDSAEHCGWCGELTAGDLEDSYLTGCENCDGYIGHHEDD